MALSSRIQLNATAILEENILTFFYQSENRGGPSLVGIIARTLLLQHPLLCAVHAASIALMPLSDSILIGCRKMDAGSRGDFFPMVFREATWYRFHL